MKRRVLTSVLLAASLILSVLAAPGGADIGSDPFNATGTVNNNHAAFDPGTPVDGEVDAFTLNPVTFAGPVAQPCIDTASGDLKIYVTPTTGYYAMNATTGTYQRSDFNTVIAVGQAVRVVGRGYVRANGSTRCVADLIYNPPNTPRAGSGYNVKCGQNTNPLTRLNGFTVLADIANLSVHWPCTKSPGDPSGFRLQNFAETPTYAVSGAIDDFGARLEVHFTPLTKYVLATKAASYSQVVKWGRQVRIFGNYQYLGGGWLFEAKSVFYPDTTCVTAPGGSGCERQVNAYVPSVQQDAMNPGHFQGQITSGSAVFSNGQYQADLVWTATTDDQGRPQWTVSGTWSVVSVTQADALQGNVTGTTSGASGLDMSYEITGGLGKFQNAAGGGDFEGGYRGVLADGSPTNFYGNNHLIIIPNP